MYTDWTLDDYVRPCLGQVWAQWTDQLIWLTKTDGLRSLKVAKPSRRGPDQINFEITDTEILSSNTQTAQE